MTSKRKKSKVAPASYRKRTYRRSIDPDGLVSFEVQVRETDLHILASEERRDEALRQVLLYRGQLENYIATHPDFLTSLAPLAEDPLAPPIVREMLRAADAAGVGPLAAVAGAMAECVGRDLLTAGAKEVIVENGGDIFMGRARDCQVGIFAGASPLSNRVGIRIRKESMPLGVCTSSGTVGHSLSFGSSDAVTVLAPSVPLADAVATRLGNVVKEKQDINRALALAETIAGITGVVVVRGLQLGAWGGVELVEIG